MIIPLYVGMDVGVEQADFKQDALIRQGATNIIDKTHFSGSGISGSVFGGYQYRCRRAYLAGELDASTSSTDFKSSNSNSTFNTNTRTKYKISRSYGFSVLPGFFISDASLLYARLGYARGRFNVTTSDTSLQNVNTMLSGFCYGVGVKQSLSKKVDLRLEYNQTHYQTTSMHVVASPVIKDTEITPKTARMEFAVVYSLG